MNLEKTLKNYLPANQISTRLIDRHRMSRDASFYRMVPQAVVKPETEADIAKIFEFSRDTKIPITFRAGGTSLSGQAVTDGVIVEINQHWRKYNIHENADKISLQPAVIGGHANAYLRSHKRKIGPDPASIDSAFIGGIVANNASGMCCGVVDNSYNTLDSLRTVLPNGLTINTGDPNSNDVLHQKFPEFYNGLLNIKKEIENLPILVSRIQDKTSRKNTMGYTLQSFLDHQKPIDILAHVLVGSEGTLGFISEVTFKTLPDHPMKATALLFFEDAFSAAETVGPLRDAEAEALEIMDRAALRSIEDQEGLPQIIKTLPDNAAGLLVEFQADNSEDLDVLVKNAEKVLANAKLLEKPTFTQDDFLRATYWRVRKGLLASHASHRRSGTVVITEDVCVRMTDLATLIIDLQKLFKKHHYDDAIIFGHAKDGNLHFIVAQSFDKAGTHQYEVFMDDVVRLIVDKFDGALKAEHGTGRNMAPFLEDEWGEDAVRIMKKIKTLFDPFNILNPGVIFNDDPKIHLKNTKEVPVFSEDVDKCMECGFCESWCASADLTLTPRGRIAVMREIKTLELGDLKDKQTAKAILKDYQYDAVDTCAADGLCAVGCPVDIDTGKYMKHLRDEGNSSTSKEIAHWTFRHFQGTTQLIKLALWAYKPIQFVFKGENLSSASRWIHDKTLGLFPALSKFTPGAAPSLPKIKTKHELEVVYFPSCLTRSMGFIPGEDYPEGTAGAFLKVLDAAKIKAIYPKNVEKLCCGTPYSSKGFTDILVQVASRTVENLWESSNDGNIPIVMDTSPCTYQLKGYDKILSGVELAKWRQLKIYDIVDYLHDIALPRVTTINKVPGQAVLHPTCSTTKMGMEDKLLAIAKACAEEAVIPEKHACCGFAGDRGMLVPELTESASRDEALEVKTLDASAGHYSSSRTCEMGMAHATDESYSSIIQLVAKAVK